MKSLVTIVLPFAEASTGVRRFQITPLWHHLRVERDRLIELIAVDKRPTLDTVTCPSHRAQPLRASIIRYVDIGFGFFGKTLLDRCASQRVTAHWP